MRVVDVAGNHDFVQNTEEELKKLLGLKELFYSFQIGGVRFIVLNGLDVSRFAPPENQIPDQQRAVRSSHAG